MDQAKKGYKKAVGMANIKGPREEDEPPGKSPSPCVGKRPKTSRKNSDSIFLLWKEKAKVICFGIMRYLIPERVLLYELHVVAVACELACIALGEGWKNSLKKLSLQPPFQPMVNHRSFVVPA